MVCEWTGDYLYQPNTTNKCLMDIVCDAIMRYVVENGENHGISITESNAKGWECHGKSITVKQYNVVSDKSIYPIEEVTEIMLALYENYMQDESSDFGENAYCIGEPWSNEDIEIFVRENLNTGIIEVKTK